MNTAKLRLLVSKTKSGRIKRVCLVANESFIRQDTKQFVCKGQKIPYTKHIDSEEQLAALSAKCKEVFGKFIEIRGPKS